METNPYINDRTQQQNQVHQLTPVEENGQQFIQPQNLKTSQRITGQKPVKPAKMSKARALKLVNALKRTLAVASIISFGMFGGLVAMHQVGTTTTQSTQSTSSSSNTSSKSTSSSQNSNNFFKQQGGNTSGTSSSTSSSTTTSSSSSAPVTGTTTS
jgi:hypothetical protein